MSPEVVSGNFALAASDLWSFGVMLFMMVISFKYGSWARSLYSSQDRA